MNAGGWGDDTESHSQMFYSLTNMLEEGQLGININKVYKRSG